MPTTFTDYDIRTNATPSIDPPPEAPALLQFRMIHQLKLLTPEGNVETDYPPVTAREFQHSFTVPHHVVASSTLFDSYVFDRLAAIRINPPLNTFMIQHIVNSTYDASHQNPNTDGIQITVQLKITTTVELVSPQAMYDRTVSLLGEEAVIMEDGGGSVQRSRRGASKAAIDGLKKEVVFSNGDEEDEQGPCAVCLEEFLEETEVVHIPCSHVFHHKCIVPWLERNHSCPMCRRCVVPE